MYGLDVHKAIVDNIYENTNDYARNTFKMPIYVENLIKEGKLGKKTKIGLYKDEESQVFDVEKNKYRDIKKYNIPFIDEVIEKFKIGDYEKGINVIFTDTSKEAQICKEMLINYIIYAITTAKEVACDIQDCDIAMAEGFNWIPPYALLQIIGKDSFKENALKIYKQNEKDIYEILRHNVKSKYKYQKFLKAKR